MTTKRRARAPSEDQIHVACAQWLEWQFPQHPPEMVKRHGVRWISHELRNAKGAVEGGKRKARGCRAGDPDIELLYMACGHFVELKTRKGSLRTSQIAERARIVAAGGKWALCRSPEDLIEKCREWGFPIRGEARRHVQEPVVDMPARTSITSQNQSPTGWTTTIVADTITTEGKKIFQNTILRGGKRPARVRGGMEE